MPLLLIEVVLWILISSILVVESYANVKDTDGDLEYARTTMPETANGRRRIILAATMAYRGAFRELVGAILFFGIGLGALLTVLLDHVPSVTQVYSALFPVSMFIILITNTIVKHLNRNDRRMIIRDAVDQLMSSQSTQTGGST